MKPDDAKWQSWAALMARVQGGDGEAYRTLLDELGPLLFAYVRRRVFNPNLVEDVYQEVLLTLHKARHSYQSDRPFGPWLFTVARHSLLDALAKNRKFAERELPVETLPESAKAELDGSLGDDLQEALQSLPEDNRRAVELLKLEGRSLQEAAREMKCSVAALKVRAHRGYRQMRLRLLKRKRNPG